MKNSLKTILEILEGPEEEVQQRLDTADDDVLRRLSDVMAFLERTRPENFELALANLMRLASEGFKRRFTALTIAHTEVRVARGRALEKATDEGHRNRQPGYLHRAARARLLAEDHFGADALKGPAPQWYTEIPTPSLAQKPVDFIDGWVVWKLSEVSASPIRFQLSDALVHLLAATDLRGVLCADLKLPVPAFFLEIPSDVLYITAPGGRKRAVRAVAVVEGMTSQQDRSEFGPILAGRHILVSAHGEPEADEDSFGGSTSFFAYPAQDKESPVEAALGYYRRHQVEEVMAVVQLGEHVFSKEESYVCFIKLILNFIVYLGGLASPPQHVHAEEIANILKGKKRKNLRQPMKDRLVRLENDRVFTVGTEVVISDELRQCIRRGGGGQKLTYRTLVRGHWRNQACGPQRMQRRLKWIEPHIRGAELPTAVVGHTYTVKEKTE